MPKDKKLTSILPRMYKWNCENLGLFFWVKAQTTIIATITLDQAIKSYVKFMGISPDDWDMDSMRATYARLQNEFLKGDNENTKKNK